jgi:hypothetical protein
MGVHDGLEYASVRSTREKRPALWHFEQLSTLRRRVIQRAGRLIRPQSGLTLSMSANTAVQNELFHYLDQLEKTACSIFRPIFSTLGLTSLAPEGHLPYSTLP